MAYEVWVQDFDYGRQVEIVVVDRRNGDASAALVAPTWIDLPPNEPSVLPDECVWKMRHYHANDLLSALADAAWKRGWRPKGHQTADTTAQTKHLDDMRAVVSKLLSVDLPTGPKSVFRE